MRSLVESSPFCTELSSPVSLRLPSEERGMLGVAGERNSRASDSRPLSNSKRRCGGTFVARMAKERRHRGLVRIARGS
jgi:hypothetical protein